MHYSIDTYCLLLDYETMKHIAGVVCYEFTEDDYDNDSTVFNEQVLDAVGAIQHLSCFDGHTYELDDEGVTLWYTEFGYYDDELFFVLTKGVPTLVHAPYESIDEIIEEFNDALSEYLPEGFDYRKNLLRIIGTVRD